MRRVIFPLYANFSEEHTVSKFRAEVRIQPRSWRQYVPPERWHTAEILHGATTQKINMCIHIAVDTSDPTNKMFRTANFKKRHNLIKLKIL
jgi:hypothetical protein